MVELIENDETILERTNNDTPTPTLLSKNAQKRLLKQENYLQKKVQKKAAIKQEKQKEAERKRKEWDEKLSSLTEEEKLKLIETRKEMRKERMDKRSEERGRKIEKLERAKVDGQKIVVDLDFAHLMTGNEINSLVHQIMYCYAVNGRCDSPAHLWLTGCRGEIQTQLQRLPGFDKWFIEKESRPYIDALEQHKENLVYLTADAETVLHELDPKKIYIIGGLVDRNRWKGITMNKAKDQGISTAKLPIGSFLKMSSSQGTPTKLAPFGEDSTTGDAAVWLLIGLRCVGFSEEIFHGNLKCWDIEIGNFTIWFPRGTTQTGSNNSKESSGITANGSSGAPKPTYAEKARNRMNQTVDFESLPVPSKRSETPSIRLPAKAIEKG